MLRLAVFSVWFSMEAGVFLFSSSGPTEAYRQLICQTNFSNTLLGEFMSEPVSNRHVQGNLWDAAVV